jgi:predicted PurR-regulated permease PerM
MGAGIGLFLAYLLDNTVLNFDRPNKSNDANVAIYLALIAIFGGLGLLISHIIEKKESKEQNKA